MKIEQLTVQDIRRGYLYEEGGSAYRCTICNEAFHCGEIYPVDGRFFEAYRAITLHMEQQHGDYLHQLIHSDSKYNSLTENQRQLFTLFSTGMADKEIAKETGVSTSTVRHQKFIFREKAKQARLYLAMYESVFESRPSPENAIIPIHDSATMVDQRYVVTEEERQRILRSAFSSLSPLKLKTFSPKEKKKVVILSRIAQEFEPGRQYNEQEVSEILRPIFEDFATLRRYLIEYGFMKRTQDGSSYWLA